MTRSRVSPLREILGVLGSMPATGEILKVWNTAFAKEKRDAVMVRYPCTGNNLPERLSEMFHFDRRGYIVAPALRNAIIPLLDAVTPDAVDGVDTVINEGGVLRGLRMEDPHRSSDDIFEERWRMWFAD